MTRSNASSEERELFDLPLAAPTEPRAGNARGRTGEASQTLDLFSPTPSEIEGRSQGETPQETSAGDTPPGEPQETAFARFGERVVADLLDFGAALIVLAVAWLGALAMGVGADLESWPAFAALGVVFSFLYQTVPLAFWGATPGMALRNLVARTTGGGGISFRQAMFRWAAWMLTLGLAGLPYLVDLSGRSLADRAGASRTLRRSHVELGR